MGGLDRSKGLKTKTCFSGKAACGSVMIAGCAGGPQLTELLRTKQLEQRPSAEGQAGPILVFSILQMLGVRDSLITKFRTVCPGVVVVGGRCVEGTGSRRKAKRMQGRRERDRHRRGKREGGQKRGKKGQS